MGAVEAYHVDGIQAWDVAAGKLIIEEAGGIVIDTAGKYNFHFLHTRENPTSISPIHTLQSFRL